MKKNFNYQDIIGEGNPLLRYPQLLNAAIDEFSQKKFMDASLNDIIKRADMSKGSLYHHFGDKFGLFLALADIIIKKKISFFIPYLQKKEGSGDFFNSIKDVIRATADFMLEDERMYQMFNRNLEAGEELTNRMMQYFPNNYGDWFFKLICSAIESGQIDSKYSPEYIVRMLDIQFSNIHKFLPDGVSAEEAVEVIDRIIDMLQYGIAAKKEDK